MSDAASFDAVMQYSLLEVFCEALDAAIFVTDKLDEVTFASVRLMHHFPLPENAIAPGKRARDLYGALYDAGCRFGSTGGYKDKKREDWVAERVATAWKERVDTIEPCGPDRWFRVISRRFSSGLGLSIIQNVTDHKRKELQWRTEHERVRMTEEILDALPVAIAVKDRNLNFAAVNQQFCKMLKTTSDSILGHSAWDIFDEKLAGSLEEADWHLLATGEDREDIVKIERPGEEPVSFLHRARRIGKAGGHYIPMSFDELPLNKIGMPAAAIMPRSLPWTKSSEASTDLEDNRNPIGNESRSEKSRKVAYIRSGSDNETIVAEAAKKGIELCIIRSETEFGAFLPAIEKAGIKLDLVVIEPNADFAFATLSAKHGIRHRMLSPGANVMESIVDAFERKSRPPATVASPPQPTDASPETVPNAIDVLAVEDNPVNRLVLEQILESLGLNFVVVGEGRKAIERIAEVKPQIVLVDVTLPDMEVDQFMPSLQVLLTEKNISPPVIGLIAKDDPDQRQICRNAGLTDAMAKPLSPEAIDRMLRKHLFSDPVHGSRASRSAA